MPRVISAAENETVLASFKREKRGRGSGPRIGRRRRARYKSTFIYQRRRGEEKREIERERKGKKFIIGSP